MMPQRVLVVQEPQEVQKTQNTQQKVMDTAIQMNHPDLLLPIRMIIITIIVNNMIAAAQNHQIKRNQPKQQFNLLNKIHHQK